MSAALEIDQMYRLANAKSPVEDWAFYLILGVADRARTHDNRNHNPAAEVWFYSIKS